MMQFTSLDDEEQLRVLSESKGYQVILKHNTTCPISKGVLDRLRAEAATIPKVDSIQVLDVLEKRELSNAIAGRFGVPHQSPQVLLIKDGRCTYQEWGYDISANEISKAVG